jgi:hypothetical protein
LCGCKISLTLKEEYSLMMFEKKRGIFGPKRDEVTGENCITRRVIIICTLLQILLG